MKELVRGSFFFYEIGQLRLAFFVAFWKKFKKIGCLVGK